MKPSISIWHCGYDMVIALIPRCTEDECKLSLSPEWNIDLNEHEEDCKLSLSLEWNADLDKDKEDKCKLSLSLERDTDMLPSIVLSQWLIFHNYFNSRLSVFSVHTSIIKMLFSLKCFCILRLRRGIIHPKCAWHNSNRDSEHHRKSHKSCGTWKAIWYHKGIYPASKTSVPGLSEEEPLFDRV